MMRHMLDISWMWEQKSHRKEWRKKRLLIRVHFPVTFEFRDGSESNVMKPISFDDL